jgi:ABC-type multidrug transport system ATPase subunit
MVLNGLNICKIGAGKTTTINILTGMQLKTRGKIFIGGNDID